MFLLTDTGSPSEKLALKEECADKKVVVPGKTLNEISKILSGEMEDMVDIYLAENHILFEFDNTKVVSRLIEGDYFKIDQMLSSDYETKVKLIKRISGLYRQGNPSCERGR